MLLILRNWFFAQWSKIAIGVSLFGAALLAYRNHKQGIVDEAQDEIVDEIREIDNARAREIRDNVDAARGNVRLQPSRPKDERGYRD